MAASNIEHTTSGKASLDDAQNMYNTQMWHVTNLSLGIVGVLLYVYYSPFKKR